MLLGPQPGINPGINPGTCLRSHRRHSGNFPGPTCSVKGAKEALRRSSQAAQVSETLTFCLYALPDIIGQGPKLKVNAKLKAQLCRCLYDNVKVWEILSG